jgi:hypothetical protein
LVADVEAKAEKLERNRRFFCRWSIVPHPAALAQDDRPNRGAKVSDAIETPTMILARRSDTRTRLNSAISGDGGADPVGSPFDASVDQTEAPRRCGSKGTD